jgi:predicted DNA binding CopG/RHH family protein
MTKLNLDTFEQDILDSVENDEWRSKGNIQERLVELQGFLKHEKKKSVSIRLSENDLYALKKKDWKMACGIKILFKFWCTNIRPTKFILMFHE